MNTYALAYRVFPRAARWFWGSRMYHFFCQWRNPGCNTCWRRREGISELPWCGVYVDGGYRVCGRRVADYGGLCEEHR